MENENTTFMYGDRVRFYWEESHYDGSPGSPGLIIDWEGYLEGLYGGEFDTMNGKAAVVTVTTEGQFRGQVLHPWMRNLERIEHPAISTKKEDKDDTRPYDLAALYEMRDNIMDNFEFSKVAAVMDFLGWEWATGNDIDRTYIPDESDIRRAARRLMDEVIEKHIASGGRNQCIATGGFEVELNVCEEDGIPDLSLKFVVDDWYEGGDVWDEYEKNIDKRKENGRFKPLKK